MGWRDMLVSLQSRRDSSVAPPKGHFEDFEDFEPRYEKQSSFFIENSSQDSTQQKTSPISSKLSTPQDWLTAWREVAAISSGLTAEDIRLPFVMAALGVCDAAFIADDWPAFQEAKIGVVQAMKKGFQPPGAKNH